MPALDVLARSFARNQRAEGKRPATILTYGGAIRHLALHCSPDLEGIDRASLRDYFGTMLETQKASSVSVRFRAIRVFLRWCVEEGELPASPMDRMKQPKVRVTPPEVYTDIEVRKLLNACDGPWLADKRDKAMLRFLLDTGARRGELAGVKIEDIDLDAGVVKVDGKTGQRVVPFSPATGQALDRYLRARARSRHAARPELWVGAKGPLTGNGVLQAVLRRGRIAGVEHVYVHRFRHHRANSWLMAGGSEGDLMQIAGWRSRSMLDRYGASAANARAIEAFRRLTA